MSICRYTMHCMAVLTSRLSWLNLAHEDAYIVVVVLKCDGTLFRGCAAKIGSDSGQQRICMINAVTLLSLHTASTLLLHNGANILTSSNTLDAIGYSTSDSKHHATKKRISACHHATLHHASRAMFVTVT
jgi:hypothetical protein